MPGGVNGRLLLTTDAVGGVWRYSLDLARGLADCGTETVLAVLGPAPDAAQVREMRAVPKLTPVQTALALDWTAQTLAELAAASERLAGLAALTGVTGVHLHAPALVGEARWPAPVVVTAHSCVGTWWRAVRGGTPPDDFAWRIAATAAGLRRAAAVIAPTAAHGRAVEAAYGPVGVRVVHNGAVALPPGENRRERAVLTAGRLWDEGKGVAVLDRAAAELGAPVRAAGALHGPNGASVRLHAAEALGALPPGELAAAYRSLSVFASMAAYEPFGLCVLEAAQAGMRLVLSDIPSFRELWDGAAAFVGDAAALPEALRTALDAEGDGGARERGVSFSIERMVDGVLRAHRDVGGLAA